MTRMHCFATAAALLFGAATAQGQSEEDKLRQQALKEKVDYLQDKTKQLPEPGGKEPLINAFFKDGLFFKSSDGNFEAKIGGRVYVNYRQIFEKSEGAVNGVAAPGQAVDSFFMRTARLQYDGTFYKDVFVRVEMEGPGFALKDGYIGWKASDAFSVKAGQMKGPISQEETCSSRFIDFADRSLLNRMAVGHDIGIMANGKLMDGTFEYEAGLFNGNAIQKDQGRNANDFDAPKDFMGRLRISPFKTSSNEALSNFRIGVYGTFGKLTGGAPLPAATNAVPDITTPLSGTRIFDFTAAAVANGNHSRGGAEISWATGPFSLRGEYLTQYVRLLTPASGIPSIRFNSMNVQATYLLTGETKPVEGRVKPKTNFNPADGGWGAFELAVRYASLEVDDAADNGLLVLPAPAGATIFARNDGCTEIAGGVNWWWNPYTRLTVDYIQYDFAEPLSAVKAGVAEEMDQEKMVMVRWQIDF